jgi:DNA-binding NtrC family response regulator
VGGTAKVKVDLSVIAATNRSLESALQSGKLREDLYYRLKVVTIALPPLRERKEDIPALIEAFIAEFNLRHGGKIHGIAPRALKLVMEHSWPGNVRELKNAIESAAILASGSTIGPEAFADLARPRDLPPDAQGDALRLPIGTSLERAERELILATLARYTTRAEAARALGIGLRTLYTKLRSYGAETARGLPKLPSSGVA